MKIKNINTCLDFFIVIQVTFCYSKEIQPQNLFPRNTLFPIIIFRLGKNRVFWALLSLGPVDEFRNLRKSPKSTHSNGHIYCKRPSRWMSIRFNFSMKSRIADSIRAIRLLQLKIQTFSIQKYCRLKNISLC